MPDSQCLLHDGSYDFYWIFQPQDTSECVTSDRWNSDLFRRPPSVVNEDSLVFSLWAALMFLNTAMQCEHLFRFQSLCFLSFALFFQWFHATVANLVIFTISWIVLKGSPEFQDAPMYPLWSVSEGTINFPVWWKV